MSDLTAIAIRAALDRLGAPAGPITIAETTASTNDDAREAAARGAEAGAAFLADAQTAGRGRSGHTWHSPPGANLYLSILSRPRVAAAAVAPITLAVGVAVAGAIEARLAAGSVDRAPIAIKWPNDVLAGRRKIAGVLVEGQLRGGAVISLVIGVGVNVATQRFPEEIAARATSLAILGCADLDRSTLAAALIHAIGDAVTRFERAELAPFAAELARRDALSGRRIAVGDVAGTGAGIDIGGRLLIRGDDGAITPVISGDVSVSLDAGPVAASSSAAP